MPEAPALNTGWLDASIGTVFAEREEMIRPFAWLLITSLDSTNDLTRVPVAGDVVRRHPTAHFLGGGLAIQRRDLQSILSDQRLFFGFDEVWFFESEPMERKPDDVAIVAPLDFRTSKPTPGLERWMTESACRLGLGDGVGMNYVTSDENVADRLVHAVVEPE